MTWKQKKRIISINYLTFETRIKKKTLNNMIMFDRTRMLIPVHFISRFTVNK